MKRRFGTAPDNGTAETKRLAWWLALVAALIALGYLSRLGGGKPDPNVLYHWSTAIGGLVQDVIVLALVLWIAGFSTRLLALLGVEPGRALHVGDSPEDEDGARAAGMRFAAAPLERLW